MFLKYGNDISVGAGLLMGAKSRLRTLPPWDGYYNCMILTVKQHV